ncbi:uncharacterized protein BDW43DRAFT_294617 [Aspergillus alliaceus]|uniref:uncharacterized protein n=1 Tax=Petromyces alliaceus TaxID=209559 RepID=UPI0012A45F37|nr:uncharacterized protein BDW43DRAFT_294617 [Aspergillus alliaceus]KAB8227259.1 hypothetical protein BDW43DRAFT_294617 [Aspergillus alliaceus]
MVFPYAPSSIQANAYAASFHPPAMCSYTSARLLYRGCTRDPPHTFAKHYYKRCPQAVNTGVFCTDAVFDPSLGMFGITTRRGTCPSDRDSGISTNTVVESDILD